MEQLTEEYRGWCEDNDLPLVCAEEQQRCTNISTVQRHWLMDFEARWDRQQALLDRIEVLAV